MCSRTPKPSPVGSKVASNRRVLQAKHRVPNLCEADEVLEICTAKTADTSSVLPYGNPPSPRGKAYKKAKTSRLRTKFAVFSKPVGRWQCLCNKLAIQRSLICLLPPKTNGYRNENGGRGNPSPTTKKPKPRSAAVCSHHTQAFLREDLVASNCQVLQAKHWGGAARRRKESA